MCRFIEEGFNLGNVEVIVDELYDENFVHYFQDGSSLEGLEAMK